MVSEKLGKTDPNRPPTLTSSFCKGVKEPGRYGDRRGSYGLSLMVRETSNGKVSKAWAQRLRLDGQEFNIGLGNFPLVSLAQARETAFRNAQQTAQGIDIREAKKQRRMIPTFASATESMIQAHATRWTGKTTEYNSRRMLEKYALPVLGKERIDRITSPDVIAVLKPIWAEKAATAKRVNVLLKMVFDWARAHGYISLNPADDISGALPKQDAVNHHEACPWREVPQAVRDFRATRAAKYSKLAYEFVILTASRITEVREARWDEIDWDTGTWTIPATRMKGRNNHRVPLSSHAMDVLHGAYAETGGIGLIFGTPSGRPFSLSTLVKTLRENGKTYTMHGFRSAFRDWCADNAIERELAEVALSHKVGSAVEHAYWRSDIVERRREIMEQWSEFVMGGADTRVDNN